jgi:hypothetical protein
MGGWHEHFDDRSSSYPYYQACSGLAAHFSWFFSFFPACMQLVNQGKVPWSFHHQNALWSGTRVSAILTMVAGAILYWIDSAGFSSNWTRSGPGWGFGLGGVLGLIGFLSGNRFGNNIMTFGRTAMQIDGKPTAEQKAIMEAAQKPLGTLGVISTVALILALICMATARYWRF